MLLKSTVTVWNTTRKRCCALKRQEALDPAWLWAFNLAEAARLHGIMLEGELNSQNYFYGRIGATGRPAIRRGGGISI